MIKKISIFALGLLATIWLISAVFLRFEPHKYAELTAGQMDQAAAYLQGKFEPVTDAWQWQKFEPEPGIVLRSGLIDAVNAKGTVIVIPGFTGSIEMVMHEIMMLNAAGFRVASLEYRGQGQSWRPLPNPEKGYVKDYSILAADIAQFTKQIRIDGKPLYFYSISKGAHITMRMAAEHDLDVSAYALIVPMIKINTGDMNYKTVGRLARLFNTLGLGAKYAPGQSAYPHNELDFGVATDCNANPNTAQSQSALFAIRPELRTRGITMGWIDATMSSTEKLLDPNHISKIKAPVKIFTAGIDTLVNTEATHEFCSALENCQLSHYESARHCITRENFTLYNGIITQSINHFMNQR